MTLKDILPWVAALVASPLTAAIVAGRMNRGLQRQVHALEKERASHESTLRESVEFRLKLYAQSLESIGQASRAMGQLVDYFSTLSVSIRTGVQLELDDGHFNALFAAGFFLPPSLDAAFDEVLQTTGKFANALMGARALQRDAALAVINEQMTKSFAPSLDKFRKAAHDWKRSIWTEGGRHD